MSKSDKYYEDLTDLLIRGMKAVHQKLRKDKIKAKEPLVVMKDGRVVLLDPKTMEEVSEEEWQKRKKDE